MITLEDIVAIKYKEIEELESLQIERERVVHPLTNFIKDKPFISEIKKSSPSMGSIAFNLNIEEQAKSYQRYGAGAISVLTEKNFFSGSIDDLMRVAKVVDIPILCKDFFLNIKQVLNAYNAGADVILIIASILDQERMGVLVCEAERLGLSIIFEIHEMDEFDKVKNFKPQFLGVNSRDLKSMKIDKLKCAETISKLSQSKEFFIIAESGIESGDDIKLFRNAGADAFLIGTSLMRTDDLRGKFEEFYRCL